MMRPEPPHLTDEEVREICEPLEQPAAMARYFERELGIKPVRRKPNGMPLIGRDAYRRALGADLRTLADPAPEQPNRARLRALTGGRA